jgi:DNA transposition AAA+ family ATPase
MERPRPIFIDEADYLLRQADMLDTMRDIYDTTGSPVILIGMEEMARKVQTNGRFARRITQWVEFDGIDLADTRVLADTVCEIGVADDLLAYVHKAARANIGRMTTALARIETFGRTNGHGEVDSDSPVTLKDWGKRPLFYDQPRFGRR